MAEPGDGFSIIQKRVWELQNFEILLPGEPGYVDPSTIFLMVDNVTWPEAKKIGLIEFITNLHKEQGPIYPDSITVTETYNSPFNLSSYYLKIDTWREVIIDGEIHRETIPIKNFTRDKYGFSFTLASYKDGDIVDYIAFE